MKILLSSIGSRGDVQPLLALAIELQALGHRATLCVAPNFREWIESYGVGCIPIGPDLRQMAGGSLTRKPALPASEDQRQALANQTIHTQFQVLEAAVQGYELAIAAGALQIALRTITEVHKIPYIFAAYCPAVIPSVKYPPPRTPRVDSPYLISEDENVNRQLWEKNDQEFNERFSAGLNEERVKAGLDRVASIRSYMLTSRPWLAADPMIAPAMPTAGIEIVQTGAWMLSEPVGLPDELEDFLANGTPPIYLGFGSMQAYDQTGRVLVAAARALGYRSILYKGWADLESNDDRDDCLTIGDVNHAKLFPRLAAIVHHGGAGTTITAARAGIAQVIIPHNYDQFYWSYRIQQLGAGVAGPTRDELNVDSLVEALRTCLQPEVTGRAQELVGQVELHGARIAARRINDEFG